MSQFTSSPRYHCSLCAAFARLNAPEEAVDATAPARSGRRRFNAALAGAGAALLLPAAGAREGVDVGKQSSFSKLVPAEQVEQAATQQYAQLLQEARNKNALVGDRKSVV
jgi:hypothetical protein